jgi:hypothetical protein
MVRRAAARVIAAAAFAVSALPGAAQSLQRVTVESFGLSADSGTPRTDVPFHLIVTLHARQHLTQVQNLELPMLAELELLGDERQTLSGPRGTQYREAITVVARHAGTLVISPATLQAIDARDGKPKEWFTNQLTLHVAGAPAVPNGRAFLAAGLAGLRVLLWLLGAACIALVMALFLRRRERLPPPLPEAPPVPVITRSRRDQFQDALTVLRAERTRAAAVRVRTAVWRMIGASDGATLGDVLRRPQSADGPLRDVLIALERSAFTYDDDLHAAIEDAGSALERYVEVVPQ